MLRKIFDHRNWAIAASGSVVLLLVVLAMGLGDMHFKPGQPLARRESAALQVSTQKVAEQIANIPLWKELVFWTLVLLLVSLVAALFPPEWRKKILKYFLRYSLFVLFLFIIVKNFRKLFPAINLDNLAAVANSGPASVPAAPAVFTPPQVPSLLLYLISLGVILALAGLVFLLLRGWLHKPSRQKDPQVLKDLAEVARSSLAELSTGRKWEDAIINCYARMNAVVDTHLGLRRRQDLTAGEFVARLEWAGLPSDPVRRLTRLFEAARYGTGQASQAESAEAVDCLRAVLQACGVNQ